MVHGDSNPSEKKTNENYQRSIGLERNQKLVEQIVDTNLHLTNTISPVIEGALSRFKGICKIFGLGPIQSLSNHSPITLQS